MATEGQKTLIRTIMSERELEGHHIEWVEDRLDRADNALVQTIITRLKALPKKGKAIQETLAVEVTPRDKVTVPGFYRNADGVYKVVQAKYTTRLYANRVTAKGFEYEKGAFFNLFADQAMTSEEVRAHGCQTGVCANCSIELTDPISVQIGLGTSCGPSILGKEAYKGHRKAVLEIPEVKAAHKAHQAALKAARDERKADQDRIEAQGVLV